MVKFLPNRVNAETLNMGVVGKIRVYDQFSSKIEFLIVKGAYSGHRHC